MRRPAPVDQEVEYGISEMFFSTTDSRGVILTGNDVFVKVSGYSKDELVGMPHSIIRHPDMPRAVFRLLWDTLHAGRSIAAYVKNLSKSGRYYWVLAYVQPVDCGYLSIRIKPTSPILQLIPGVYKSMLDAEEKGGMDAAVEVLVKTLGSLGFASYEEFMTHALTEELKAANAHFGERKASAQTSGASALESGISRAQALFGEISRANHTIFSSIDSLARVGKLLTERLKLLSQLTSALKRMALNAAIQAERIGEQAACLTVVATLIQNTAAETAADAEGIQDLATVLIGDAQGVGFNIGAARIQTEMCTRFLSEVQRLLETTTDQAELKEVCDNCHMLVSALDRCTSFVTEALSSFEKRISQLGEMIGGLEEQILTLEVAKKSGFIEATRIGADANLFFALLQEMGAMVNEERGRLIELREALQAAKLAARTSGSNSSAIAGRVGTVVNLISNLQGAQTQTPVAEVARLR